MVLPSSGRKTSRLSSLTSSTGRYSRATLFAVERPPIIIEWGDWLIRVGYADKSHPQMMVPSPREEIEECKTLDDWYRYLRNFLQTILHQFVSKDRRVVVLHAPFPPQNWEKAMKLSLWNLGVTAVVFVDCCKTPPLALEWKRGMIISVGRKEAYCLAHADGQAISNTLQIATCGFEAVEDSTEWTETMDQQWLNENNPDSLLQAVAKCLQECPLDVKKDVANNLVFCGDTLLLVPQLGQRLVQRLNLILGGEAPDIQSTSGSELTIVPTQWKSLNKLSIVARTTGPYRPDLVSWIGASLWAGAWYKHDDDDQFVRWNVAPDQHKS